MIRPPLPLLERLPYERQKRDNQPELGEALKAMTIGIGFASPRAIVLGADMEITSGTSKHAARKDYVQFLGNGDEDGVIGAIYAGVQMDMDATWERISAKVSAFIKTSEPISTASARAIVEESLAETFRRKRATTEMLVAIAKKGEASIFLKTCGKDVAPAHAWEIIGVGNSELALYLIQTMVGDRPQLESEAQAALCATRVIEIARRYVRMVGQGTRITAVTESGSYHYVDGGLFDKQLASAEQCCGFMWADFCDLDLSQEDFGKQFDLFKKRMLNAREHLPRIFPRPPAPTG